MTSSREGSEAREKLHPGECTESSSREMAIKSRGKRELHTIEIETFENEDPEAGPWVIFFLK